MTGKRERDREKDKEKRKKRIEREGTKEIKGWEGGGERRQRKREQENPIASKWAEVCL